MMLFHILMSVSDHELMLDNFLLRSSVTKAILTKRYLRITFVLVIGDIKGNIRDQKSAWVIIDFFHANSSDLEYFDNMLQILTHGV